MYFFYFKNLAIGLTIRHANWDCKQLTMRTSEDNRIHILVDYLRFSIS
jgi:hypothetical protein